MKKTLLILLTSISCLSTYAQVKNIKVISKETGREEVIDIPESMQSDVDSLYFNWEFKNYVFKDNDCNSTNHNPEVSDSVLMDRLSRLPVAIEMPYNDVVKKFINRYSSDLRTKVAYMLAAENFYMPTFEKALSLYDLPDELKYLPIIESALNPTAVSRQGATGLWQFMLATGKTYNLEYNSYVDERKDPIKSTWAAARYLKDLYGIYQDWSLVLAAYNCGPGMVNKAIRRAGGSKDYWKVYNFLPKETRGYVPAFIAANYIMNYYCDHGICPMESKLPFATDTVSVSKPLHLKQVSEVCKVDLDELRALNPQYKKDIIPGNYQTYSLRLPATTIASFVDNEKTIYDYKSDEFFSNRTSVNVDEEPVHKKTTHHHAISHHKVKRGETLGAISKKYGVSVAHLKKINHLKGNTISAGKSIRIK